MFFLSLLIIVLATENYYYCKSDLWNQGRMSSQSYTLGMQWLYHFAKIFGHLCKTPWIVIPTHTHLVAPSPRTIIYDATQLIWINLKRVYILFGPRQPSSNLTQRLGFSWGTKPQTILFADVPLAFKFRQRSDTEYLDKLSARRNNTRFLRKLFNTRSLGFHGEKGGFWIVLSSYTYCTSTESSCLAWKDKVQNWICNSASICIHGCP